MTTIKLKKGVFEGGGGDQTRDQGKIHGQPVLIHRLEERYSWGSKDSSFFRKESVAEEGKRPLLFYVTVRD